jgi:hypothetical protein
MMKHGILWVLLILAVAVRSSETHGSRRILHLGRMEDLVPSSSARRRSTFSFKNKSSGTLLINSHKSKTLHQIDEDDSLQTSRNKLWPPWPFNLIGKRQHQDHHDDHRYPSTGALFWAYLRQRARIGIRQLRQRKFWFVLVLSVCIFVSNHPVVSNVTVQSIFSWKRIMVSLATCHTTLGSADCYSFQNKYRSTHTDSFY